MGYHRKKPKQEFSKACFGCGKTIYNRWKSAKYCNECSIVIRDITSRIISYIYRIKMKKEFKEYAFMVDVRVIKKRKYNY